MSSARQIFVLDRLPTPIGEMVVVTDEAHQVRALDWHDHQARMQQLLSTQYGRANIRLKRGRGPARVRAALEDYLAGKLDAIDTIEVETAGTPFQRRVWSALREIPAGTTLSYSRLAARIGRPEAVRAVGLANGSNPISVVIPCHRLIGANGSLTGYGGGLHRKRWLLQHERAMELVNSEW